MITWMQRHKKWLIITIWISTIAFVGAGFVGWGQYSYGDKAGAVAKVGNVEISMGELQKSYSQLYNQYNQMFQGDFDEEKAKSFGLQAQALKQLTEQALILNLAESYDLSVTDKELLEAIKSQEYFFNKEGVFDKDIYKQVLSRNNMTIKEYEEDLRKELLIQKTFNLLPKEANKNEYKILNTVMSIADKINYKVLTDEQISVDTSDKFLKPFWQSKQQDFMTEVLYEIKYIQQNPVSKTYDDTKISEYYTNNKTHFKDAEGKILPLDKAKPDVIKELDAKATKDAALRTYIAYKKGKLTTEANVQSATISTSNNPFNDETLQKVSKLSLVAPFMKPALVDGNYYIIELLKVIPSEPKSYAQAKALVLPLYVAQKKREKLLELAQNSLATFTGETTDFITNTDAVKLTDMSIENANNFLVQLFMQDKKRGLIPVNDSTIVLYNILEQKLLSKEQIKQDDTIAKIKSTMFYEGLIKNLSNKYQTEIFIQGL